MAEWPALGAWGESPSRYAFSCQSVKHHWKASLTMGLAPAHTPVLKKQKGAAVMDIWTNDSPIANSRRQWVPPRPAVLNGEGCATTKC